MNDEARELLVAAALQGRKQIKGKLHSPDNGDCALGILHLALHTSRLEAIRCLNFAGAPRCFDLLKQRFQLSEGCIREIGQQMNDTQGWDFLTIARKAP